jgi:hypothetical protein
LNPLVKRVVKESLQDREENIFGIPIKEINTIPTTKIGFE